MRTGEGFFVMRPGVIVVVTVLLATVIMHFVAMVMPMTVVIVIGMGTDLRLCSRVSGIGGGQGRKAVAKAAHAFLDQAEIACAGMSYRHCACRYRYRDVLDAGDPAHGGIDFGCAGSTIHAFNAVTGLYDGHVVCLSSLSQGL
jgi:hypothetical protein